MPTDQSTPSTSFWAKAYRFFAHKFVLSVFGVVLVAIASAFIQHRYFLEQQRFLCNKAFVEKKLLRLETFMEPLDRYLLLLSNIKSKQIFLKSDPSKNPKDFLKRSPHEVRKLYEQIVAELLKAERGQAVLSSIHATFYSHEVNHLLDEVQDQVKSMQDGENFTEGELKTLDNEITSTLRELVSAMRDEIRSGENSSPCGHV